jgi:hypothetical protein
MLNYLFINHLRVVSLPVYSYDVHVCYAPNICIPAFAFEVQLYYVYVLRPIILISFNFTE